MNGELAIAKDKFKLAQRGQDLEALTCITTKLSKLKQLLKQIKESDKLLQSAEASKIYIESEVKVFCIYQMFLDTTIHRVTHN